MGGGRWDDSRYHSDTSTRKSTGVPDFSYTKSAAAASGKVHDTLDPKRINSKPFGKLESRDSVDHPNSNAVIVGFDVTGSNVARAVEAQKKLPNLMNLLPKYIEDPQLAIWANDDFKVQPTASVQLSEFESDNRIDESIRNIILVGDGGGNHGESYDLLLYAAARKTAIDCLEVRQRKGYLFLYADEPFMTKVSKHEVKAVFDDNIEADIPIAEIIEEVRRMFHVFVIWPQGGYVDAREQHVELFGEEFVVTLQHPNLICELVGSVIGLNEEKVTPAAAIQDLIAVGTSKHEAEATVTALATLAKDKVSGKASKSLPASGKTAGADRL